MPALLRQRHLITCWREQRPTRHRLVGRFGDTAGLWGGTQDFKHHCCMPLVHAEEMRTANPHALPPHPQGVFLGLLNCKPVNFSAVHNPVYEILNPTPVILPHDLQCFGTVGRVNSGFGGVGGSLGTYLAGCGGNGGGMALLIRASSTASTATWYGPEVTWGLRGGLTGVREVVGARLDEGGEGGGVSNGGWGKASSLRHLSASESRGGDRGWSPTRKSSGRSPPTAFWERRAGGDGRGQAKGA